MANGNDFDGVTEFLAIAKWLSIRRAALELGKTPGALSQALKRLETRLGVALFHRTTRETVLTEAGQELLARIEPAANVIFNGLDEASQSGRTPIGKLKLVVERLALHHILQFAIPAFTTSYPGVQLDITVSNRHEGFTTDAYDAGIMIGEYIPQDMITVRLSDKFTWCVLGSPDYFRKNRKPEVPDDILSHNCIKFRRPEIGDVYKWEFLVEGEQRRIEPFGGITVNDGELMQILALKGVGLIYSSTIHSQEAISKGLLEPVLTDYSPGSDAIYLYFPRTAKSSPKLRAFIDICLKR